VPDATTFLEGTDHAVKVKLVCGALNYSDLNTVYAGLLGLGGKRYQIFGTEIAGLVTQVGAGVRGFEIGDRVVSYRQAKCGFCLRCTTSPIDTIQTLSRPRAVFQEQLWFNDRDLRLITPEVSMMDAVAFLLSGTVATQIVKEIVDNTTSVPTVLVTSANGAIGSYVTQLASRRGATVMNVVRSESVKQKCNDNGAAATVSVDINTGSRVLEKEARKLTNRLGFDVVVDLAADIYFPRCLGLLKPGGKYLLAGLAGPQSPHPTYCRDVIEKGIHVQGYTFCGDSASYEAAYQLLATRCVSAIIDSTFTADRIGEACHRAWWSSDKFGKVLVMF
jgi:NADPH:quinone reductase-like Zn-dependent oxidoreductase